MDLLRQVLLPLPLQRIIELGRENGEPILTKDMIERRIRTVNRLDPSIIRRSGYLNIRDFYYKLCTLQGELTDWSHVFVPAIDLLGRAIFLRDCARFHFLTGITDFNDSPVLEYALSSKINDIAARVISDTSKEDSALIYSINNLTILDRWPELAEFYRKSIPIYIERGEGSSTGGREARVGRVAGYLHLFDLEKGCESLGYVSGYLKSISGPNPELDEIFSESPLDRLVCRRMAMASYPFHIRNPSEILIYLEVGLKEVLPDNIQYILDNGLEIPTCDGTQIFPSINLDVTADLIEGARRMIPLVRRLPEIEGFPSDHYLTLLSVLIGESVSLDDSMERSVENVISTYMITVAHPQVGVSIIPSASIPTSESEVYYDIGNLLHAALELGCERASRLIKPVVSYLIRFGQTGQYLNELTSRLFFPGEDGFGIIGDLDRVVLNHGIKISLWKIEDRYLTIQLLLKAQQYKHPIKVLEKSSRFPKTWSQIAEIETFLGKSLEYREPYFGYHQKREEKYQEVLAELQS